MRPIVHALLVCRDLVTEPDGSLTLRNVVEILPAETIPGEVGPLVFVAFLRGVPAGEGQGAFVLRAGGTETAGGARIPLRFDVHQAMTSRQLAVHVRLPKLPVDQAGWFDLGFEWAGETLASTRFAVGTRGGAAS